VDELNASLGMLVASIPEDRAEVVREIQNIQSSLFHVGTMLSTTPRSPLLPSIGKLREEDIHALERAIDRMDACVPALTGFILPGGHPCAAFAHFSRTVCRRAERRMTALVKEEKEEVGARTILIYLNRLSDYLFVLARHLSLMMGVPDIPWEKR
jgi:cob(I)alamin adenosyltransferase